MYHDQEVKTRRKVRLFKLTVRGMGDYAGTKTFSVNIVARAVDHAGSF